MLRTGRLCTAAAVLVMLATASSQAQINPFRSNGQSNGLNNADIDLLSTAATHVNAKDPIHVGDAEDWSNPESGNAGKVTVTRLFRYAGLACHGVRYDISYKAHRPSRIYTVDWCKTKTGDWKIKS
jgi:surface antigen